MRYESLTDVLVRGELPPQHVPLVTGAGAGETEQVPRLIDEATQLRDDGAGLRRDPVSHDDPSSNACASRRPFANSKERRCKKQRCRGGVYFDVSALMV